MSKSIDAYLLHILEECSFIESVVKKDLPLDSFQQDETLKRAMVRSGEATKRIPPDFKAKWSDVPWKNMAGMRDKLIHDYMGVNYIIVYDVILNFIPKLYEQIETILNEKNNDKK